MPTGNLGGKFEKKKKGNYNQGTFREILNEHSEEIERIAGYAKVNGKDYKILNQSSENGDASPADDVDFELPRKFQGPGDPDGIVAVLDGGARKHIIEASYCYDITPINEEIEVMVKGDNEEELEDDLEEIIQRYF
ncbi:MAG: hypothetical protein ACLFQ8_03535 [Candidatus Aenigmatarchaeota archaeon]